MSGLSAKLRLLENFSRNTGAIDRSDGTHFGKPGLFNHHVIFAGQGKSKRHSHGADHHFSGPDTVTKVERYEASIPASGFSVPR